MRSVGVISDTHGLLRQEAAAKLTGVHHIVHAGDIGSPDILERLRSIAPLTAVRGNNDTEEWAAQIPDAVTFQILDHRIHMLHDVSRLAIDPAGAGVHVVISGHSHKPSAIERNGVLFLNPGSAGPQRFKLPICIATLRVYAKSVRAEIHTLIGA
ncbi:MAG TPA: metallophosphoesterase family protein [Steroidobacter sp.]|nr:metallophosphoesterase family protein [Steroidobacter sp.]